MCIASKKEIDLKCWFFFKYSGRSKDAIGLTIWNYHCMIISPKDATLMFNDII